MPTPWSGRRDSNSQQPVWKTGTLPLSYFRINLGQPTTTIVVISRQRPGISVCTEGVYRSRAGILCLDLNLRYVSTLGAKNLRWRVPDTIPSPGAVYKRFANRETVVCCGTILQRTNRCRLRPSQFRGWSSTAPHTKR